MREYKADYPTREDLFKRALSIGYGVSGAGRVSEDAYWVEDWRNPRDTCDKHPGCTLNTQVEGCEACEIVRQSDATGYDASKHYCDARCETTCIVTGYGEDVIRLAHKYVKAYRKWADMHFQVGAKQAIAIGWGMDLAKALGMRAPTDRHSALVLVGKARDLIA